tara:strand:- start:232 stop:429 length:198 start_codon:yes stop_codon:yes gene_type:complete
VERLPVAGEVLEMRYVNLCVSVGLKNTKLAKKEGRLEGQQFTELGTRACLCGNAMELKARLLGKA